MSITKPGYYKVIKEFKIKQNFCNVTFPVGCTVRVKDIYSNEVVIEDNHKGVGAPLSILDNLESK